MTSRLIKWSLKQNLDHLFFHRLLYYTMWHLNVSFQCCSQHFPVCIILFFVMVSLTPETAHPSLLTGVCSHVDFTTTWGRACAICTLQCRSSSSLLMYSHPVHCVELWCLWKCVYSQLDPLQGLQHEAQPVEFHIIIKATVSACVIVSYSLKYDLSVSVLCRCYLENCQ